MNRNQVKKREPQAPIKGEEVCDKEKKFSSSEMVKGWLDFNPSIPFSYLVAARKAAQAKNS